MPFTFSHPAIVLPFTLLPRRWYSLTGLVVGSVTPDFEYFLRMKVKSEFSHTLTGLFWFDLPLGILLTFLFHLLIRNSLILNSPTMFQARVILYSSFNWPRYFKKRWFVVVLSIIVGAASHLLWDSFTHYTGYFARALPVLVNTVKIGSTTIPIYKILQHSSSLLGAAILAYAFIHLPTADSVVTKAKAKYWILVTIICGVVMMGRILAGLEFQQYGHVIASFIAALVVALSVAPLVVTRR
ncbi:DUF4184 family protein [Rufibacter roseus]|uniref:DUF4184 family protein n=1 Tax=Rufibacter roseus TaxID=1567108 RepID=A0ABW2DPQ5_9BACT|nr:DUF4184 family protein [Rufibacter roseus]